MARGVCGTDGQRFAQQHVAGIEPRIHLHDGHARLVVARFDGAMDRRGAAPARQQARVDVQAAVARQIEHPLRQDQAVGGHHHRIGARRDKQIMGQARVLGVLAIPAQAARLRERQAMALRALLDGRSLQLHAAPGRAIGLGQHQRHFMPRIDQGLQRHPRELRRARENDAHALPPQRAGSKSPRISSVNITRRTTPSGSRCTCAWRGVRFSIRR